MPVQKQLACFRGNQLQRLTICFLSLLKTDGLNAAVPLQGVIAKERLTVTYRERLGVISRAFLAQFIHTLGSRLHEQVTSREPDVLADGKRQVGSQLVLTEKQFRTIGLGYLINLPVQIRRC